MENTQKFRRVIDDEGYKRFVCMQYVLKFNNLQC